MVVLGEEVGGAEEGQRAAPPYRVVLLDVLVGEQVHALMASRRDPARYFVIPGDVEIAVVRARDDHREAVASIRAEFGILRDVDEAFLGSGGGRGRSRFGAREIGTGTGRKDSRSIGGKQGYFNGMGLELEARRISERFTF